MATVTITFFKPAMYEGFGVIGDVVSTEAITSSGTSQQSSVSSDGYDICRVSVSGGDVHILNGANPTADTDDMLLPAGSTEYFKLSDGDVVAIINAG